MRCANLALQGRPVYIQHLGAINLKRLVEITTEERMLQFHVQEYERCLHYILPACSKIAGRHIEQTFAIIDVTGTVSRYPQSLIAVWNSNHHCWSGMQCQVASHGDRTLPVGDRLKTLTYGWQSTHY